MIIIRLTGVDIPIRVELMKPDPLFGVQTGDVVRIEAPRYALLMDAEMYAKLSQDPSAMNAFIRSKLQELHHDATTEWPNPDALLADTDE